MTANCVSKVQFVSTAVVTFDEVQKSVVLQPERPSGIEHAGKLVKLAVGCGAGVLMVRLSVSVELTVPVPLGPDQHLV